MVLRKRFAGLERALRKTSQERSTLGRMLDEAQSIGHLGSWEWNIKTGREIWSQEQYHLFGYEPGQIEPSHEAFLNLVHPDDRRLFEQFVREAFHSMKPCDFEFRLVRPDGAIRWLYARRQVFRDEKGKPERMAGTNQDITDYKLAQQALQESEATARALVNAPTDSVFLLDRQGIILDINEIGAKRLGRTVDKLIGASIYDVLPRKVAERRTRRLLRVFESGAPVRFEDDRAGFWFDTVAYPVFDASGKATKLAIVARDITERKRVEEERDKLRAQLLHAQKLESLGILAGGIAHDFSNLLMAILGHAEIALVDLPQESSVRSSIEEIIKVARRATELTQQMLDYSGKGQFVVQPTDLGELVKEMTDMLAVSISKKPSSNSISPRICHS